MPLLWCLTIQYVADPVTATEATGAATERLTPAHGGRYCLVPYCVFSQYAPQCGQCVPARAEADTTTPQPPHLFSTDMASAELELFRYSLYSNRVWRSMRTMMKSPTG